MNLAGAKAGAVQAWKMSSGNGRLAIQRERDAAGGVTMAGGAKAAGAPSGSLYHRFGSRGALLGELWLRTVTRFQEGFLLALAHDSAIEGCAAAARHVIAWSRQHDADLRMLLRGPGDFASGDWPPELRERVHGAQRRLEAALRETAERLPGRRCDALERVLLATVDLPYALARRHLRADAGRRLPARLETLAEESARAILEAH